MASPKAKPPPLGAVRLANVTDAPYILEFLNESISNNFRVSCSDDIVYRIENCVLSICQLDTNKRVVGFLAVRDYPLVPSVHPCAWEEYVWTKYKAREMNSRNTLFIHLLCWKENFGRALVDNMLRSIFMHDAYVLHIAMIKSLIHYPHLVPGQSRSEWSFRRVTTMERGMSGDMLPALCVADRTEVCPRLRIRRAVEEDNDDLVPILEQHSVRLRDLYGDFYISELIARHPESDRVLLVCEHNELAVGVMCLNTQINYESLEESFVLLPFGGLRHLDAVSKNLPKKVESNISVPDSATKPQEPMESKARVTRIFDDNEFRAFQNLGVMSTIAEEPIDEELSPNQQTIVNLLHDDGEEFDFDIVNIDTNLLRVPEMVIDDAFNDGSADNILDIINGGKEADPDKKPDKLKRNGFEMPDPPRYSGTPNAFLLELFAIHLDYDERYGFDMLEVAYEMFPDRDYCVMCLPTNHPALPLLEHFTLVTPYGCKTRYMNESLYVAHVNSIRGNLSVRPGEACDAKPLKDVLAQAPRMEKIMDLFQSTLTSQTLLQSFTLLSEKQPIGVVIIGPLDNGTALRSHYDLEPEPRRPDTDATILAGVLSPAFEPHTRWFLRELLRNSKYSTLFWICKLFAKGDASPCRNLMSLAGYMNPVHPRQSVPNISGNQKMENMIRSLACPFALWVCERPLTSLPKVNVNNSIVVVGASRTGLAFLETLLMGPTSQYLTFSNLTLVSKYGLPNGTDHLKAADTCVPKDGRYTDRYMKSMPFYYYLDIISAAMVKIDRKKKCIHLKGGGTKNYDELVLTCGQQFQHPDYLKESLGLAKEMAKGKPCDRMLMDNPKYKPETVPMPPKMPENVFLINSMYEANFCLKKLLLMISDCEEPLSKDNQVVVFGDCIEAYSCIAALLELDLLPELIVFVEPFPSMEEPAPLRVNCFNDETIDARVQATMEELGIRVLRQCHLAAWHQIGNRVESLEFMAPLTSIPLRSFALFYYGLRAINLYAFKAINESGLVYDGGLVVGPAFETNDPSIYGAGSCVRYSRALYADRSLHKDYCSEDIGEALARLLLHKLDPFMIGNPEFRDATEDLLPKYSSTSLGWQPVMKFESPITQIAVLPGPLYYMKLRKPGKDVPMAVQQCLPQQGHNLITDKDGNYFCLHLNVLHVVDSVTCLSHKPFSPEILQQLYGKHEAFFNKLYTRYQKKEIDDLYDFFTQPWMSALYQESFRDLIDDINEQDISTIQELTKSEFALYNEVSKGGDLAQIKSTLWEVERSLVSISSITGYLHEAYRQGTFRSVIDKFVASSAFTRAILAGTNIPSECGQSQKVRKQAAKFWKRVCGQRIVLAHVSRYLAKYAVTNPHYATPKPVNP